MVEARMMNLNCNKAKSVYRKEGEEETEERRASTWSNANGAVLWLRQALGRTEKQLPPERARTLQLRLRSANCQAYQAHISLLSNRYALPSQSVRCADLADSGAFPLNFVYGKVICEYDGDIVVMNVILSPILSCHTIHAAHACRY